MGAPQGMMRPRPHGPRFNAWGAALISAAGGLLGVGAFPRYGYWPLAFISVALLSVAVDRRRCRTGAWLGLLFGACFFIPLLAWTGIYVGPLPWLLLAVAEAGFFAALGAALVAVQGYRLAPLWIATIWVLQEAVRDRALFGGFPWGRLAFSQSSSPMRWFAAVGGAPLVTFAVALAGGGLAVALRGGVMRTYLPPAGVVVAVLAMSVLLALTLRPPPDRDGATTTVALIQGNVPDVGLQFEDRPRQVLDNHVKQTMALAAEIKSGTIARPSLIVWPEDSSDLDPFKNATAFTEIDTTVKAVGVPILIGAILDGPGANHRRNVGILWSPTTGPGSEYTKRHPVPFGEYIPLRNVARLVSSDVNLVTQDMVAGHGNGLLTGGPYPIGDVICFEVAYDELIRSSVLAGARLLVVQTNNATFGHTAETYQQLAMSQLRAVETGRTVLQVATTGLSAVIGPDGTVRQRSGALYTPDTILATVPVRSRLTVATQLGPIPEYGLAALGLLGVGWATALGARVRRTRPRSTPQDDAEPASAQRDAEKAIST